MSASAVRGILATLAILAAGVSSPDISVSPASFSEALPTGGRVMRTLTIRNTGGSDLTYRVGIRPGPFPAAADVQDASRFDVLILHASSDPSEIQALLRTYSDLSSVDAYDCYNGTPSLAQLLRYRSVIVANDHQFPDATEMGNVLADYVDAGGGVVLTVASFLDVWTLSGRFVSGGYMPLFGTSPLQTASLGAFLPQHSIMRGVTSVAAQLIAHATVAAGAFVVASWNDGEPFVATQGAHVATVNAFVAQSGHWTGQLPLVLHNAALWSAGQQWLSAGSASGVVTAGGAADVALTFDASDLLGGSYQARIVVSSNDPDRPRVTIPVALQAIGVPELAMSGAPVAIESTRDYVNQGAITEHDLPVAIPPAGGGTIELVADGDYGDFVETATATAEGLTLGSVGGTGTDCAPASGSFPLVAGDLAALVADGTVHVEVKNSADVDTFCAVNRHTVRLEYEARADRLDFGRVYVGASRELLLTLRNAGTDTLVVSAIGTDVAAFTPSLMSATIPIGDKALLHVTFAPASDGSFDGTLTIGSNDPSHPLTTVPLHGTAVDPPGISVSPASVSASLFTGERATRTVTIDNTGGSELTFALDAQRAVSTGHFDVLILHSASSPEVIRTILQAYPDISSVDLFDAFTDTPTLAELSRYAAVIVANSYPFQDPDGVGNVLADYVDGGGGVVLTLASFVDQWSVGGRFVSGGYMPFENGAGPQGSSSLGSFDASHPIMSGVTNASVSLLAYATLPPGAGLVASWRNGFPFVATQGQHVVGVNAYVAETGFFAGDVPLVLHNAAFWTTRPRWLSAVPSTGVVPAGGRAQIALTIDATGLGRGDYDAQLALTSNDPDESRITFPVHLTVPCDTNGSGCTPLALCHDVTVPANAHCAGRVTAKMVDAGSRDGAGRPVTSGLQPAGPYALGSTPVTLTVTDQDHESSICTAVVHVVDVSPPEILVTLTPQSLWPPDHRMVPVTATVAAKDNCGTPSIILTSVSSSDGNAVDDILQDTPGTPDFTFFLRAERSPTGPGRTYTAIYRATDGSGNTATAAGYAVVPHDRAR